MLTCLFTVLLVVGPAFCNFTANHYVENLLSTLYPNEVRALNLDPAVLSNFHIDFEDTVRVIGTVKGKAEFTNGLLNGLSQAARHSECRATPPVGVNTTSRTINCTITFEELKITYDGNMKYGKMPRVNINAKGKAKDVEVFLEIVQAYPMLPSVKTFSFAHFGKIKAKFTGLGPLNRFTEALEDGYKAHIQTEVLNSINHHLMYALNRGLAQMSMRMI